MSAEQWLRVSPEMCLDSKEAHVKKRVRIGGGI